MHKRNITYKTILNFKISLSLITVVYTEQVPSGGPPSFSGRLAKYSYKLTIGAQKPGCAAKITRLPFRVMVIPGKVLTLEQFCRSTK